MSWFDKVAPYMHGFWHGRSEPGWVEPLRRLYDHELVIVSEGFCQISVQNRSFNCGAGTFLIVPPDKAHVTMADSRQGVHRYCIHFDWTFRSPCRQRGFPVFHPGRIRPALVHRPPRAVPKKLLCGQIQEPAKIQALLERLVVCWASQSPSERQICRVLLLEILLRLLSPAAGAQADVTDDMRVARLARKALDEPIAQSEAIQQVFGKLGFSYAYVCREFHKAYGTTPLQYVNAARIQRAKIFLQEGRSIAETAHLAGFNDPAYFARVFKAHTDLTPRRFRERSLRNAEKTL